MELGHYNPALQREVKYYPGSSLSNSRGSESRDHTIILPNQALSTGLKINPMDNFLFYFTVDSHLFIIILY